MATQRATPGANLPESGSMTGRKGRSGTDLGQTSSTTTPDVTAELPGETGLGSGLGADTGGFGSGDTFGTTGSTDAGRQGSMREYPRAAGVMDKVKEQASTRVNEQKVRAAEGLGSVASAIRQASEHLRSENQTLATYADKAVDQIQVFADRMRDKDPAEMVRDAERFARRNPTAFVGGAFVLGLALARFLKSSSEADYTRSLMHRDTDFGESGSGGNSNYGSANYGSGGTGYGGGAGDGSSTGYGSGTTGYGSTSGYGSGTGSGANTGIGGTSTDAGRGGDFSRPGGSTTDPTSGITR